MSKGFEQAALLAAELECTRLRQELFDARAEVVWLKAANEGFRLVAHELARMRPVVEAAKAVHDATRKVPNEGFDQRIGQRIASVVAELSAAVDAYRAQPMREKDK